jgi:D-glycero-alpha-D-manno-heptose-7-phosphate kinase
MIIAARAPYRVSLLGGGSDLDWFVNRHGRGIAIGCAITKASYVVIGPRPETIQRGILNYTSREEYLDIDSISHPIIRRTFKKFNLKRPMELTSFGEAANGSGLGGSSSFTVALLKAIELLESKESSQRDIANIACEIEIKDLEKPIGRQDQYFSALGGARSLQFLPGGVVESLPLGVAGDMLTSFCESLILVNTGISRSASAVLSKIATDTSNSSPVLSRIRDLAEEFTSLYFNTDISYAVFCDAIEDYMQRAWLEKRSLTGIINGSLSDLEAHLSRNGVKVLKLLGAGGGGYFLCKGPAPHILSSKKDTLRINYSHITVDRKGCQSWRLE